MTQQQQQALYQKIDNEIQETLRKQLFPQMHLTREVELSQWIGMACLHSTPDSLRCSYDTFKDIWQKVPSELSVYEMGIALNAVANCNATQLRCLGREPYLDVQDHVRGLAGKWSAIVNPLREAIERKYINGNALITPKPSLLTH